MKKPKNIIIIGHKNPDTDSIVSALVYTFLKKKLGQKAIATRGGEINNETKFVLKFFNQKPPTLIKNLAGQKVILLDHNNLLESVRGIEKAEIREVIDHHYLSGLKTEIPIYFRAEPLGSTSAILAKISKERGFGLTKTEAGLLLAGIISDTLFFHSPTTTLEDREIAKALAKISGIKMKELAKKMFEAKSDLKGISPQEIVSRDYKEFQVNGIKFGIGVWETTNPEKVKKIKEKIFLALRRQKKERKIPLIFFALVDILKKNSDLFLLEKEGEIAKKVFKKEVTNNLMPLAGVVSRKKQILPPLMKFFKRRKR